MNEVCIEYMNYVELVVDVAAVQVAVGAMGEDDETDGVDEVGLELALGGERVYALSHLELGEIDVHVHVEVELLEEVGEARGVHVGADASHVERLGRARLLVEVLVVDDEADAARHLLHLIAFVGRQLLADVGHRARHLEVQLESVHVAPVDVVGGGGW